MKGLPWTKHEVSLIESYLPTIVKQGNGKLVEKAPCFQELCSRIENRTQAAIAHKTRKVAYDSGLLKSLKQKAWEERSTLFDYTPPADGGPIETKVPSPMKTQVVAVPLEKLYGRVDFETFMSLVTEH